MASRWVAVSCVSTRPKSAPHAVARVAVALALALALALVGTADQAFMVEVAARAVVALAAPALASASPISPKAVDAAYEDASVVSSTALWPNIPF